MARISNQSIENVRNAADIVSVIGGYIELVKRGKDFKGKCPFHNDSRPSLSVEPNKQCWRCFTCDIGGNVFEFVIRYENLDFPGAVKRLAKMYSIKLEITGGDNKQFKDKKDQQLEIHTIADSYYHDLLFDSSDGKKALTYLQERGLSLDTIKKFKLGFSSNTSDGLLKILREKSFSSESMKGSGLIDDNEKGYYDRFRSRIMFPIRDRLGETIAFGGRKFNSDHPAKYINSPETDIYKKRKVLYGLDISGEYIRKENKIILVEGYMDLIQLYESGINNCVAISGTAFTPENANAIKYLSENVFILFDGDEAGKNAALKCGYMLFSKGVEAKIIIPPDNLDPDDWVRKDKASGILSALEKGKNVIDTHYEIFSETNSGGILENNKFIEKSLEQIVNYDDSIVIKSIIKRISKLTDIPENDIFDKLDKKKYKPQVSPSTKKESINEKDLLIYDDLIRLCCSDNLEVRRFIFDNLNTDWIKSFSHKEMYDKIYIHLKSEGEIPVSLILDQLQGEKVKNKLNTIVFELQKINPTYNMAADVLIRLEKEIKKSNRKYLVEELKNNSNPETENNILENIGKIDKEILDLKNKYNE